MSSPCTDQNESHDHCSWPFVTEDRDGTILQVPILALWYSIPADGLPHLAYWINTATDVFNSGFEPHREILEVKERDSTRHMAKLEVTKGVGRASIILFALVWTYLELAPKIEDHELEDFKRHTGFETIKNQFFGKLMVLWQIDNLRYVGNIWVFGKMISCDCFWFFGKLIFWQIDILGRPKP